MHRLSNEINLRYNIMRYKKLVRQYLYNKFEKNNIEIIFKGIEDAELWLDLEKSHKKLSLPE